MKIVFLETATLGDDVNIDKFTELGEVVRYDLTRADEIAARIGDADAVVINKLPMNETTIGSCENLKLICLTATGTNNIDFTYTDKKGIAVRNVRSYSTESVVQHTFSTFFYLYEKLNYYDNYVKSGDYANAPFFCHIEEKFHELFGKRWGIIGLGEIGHRVAQVAQAFGCEVVYYSTSGKNNDAVFKRVGLSELLATSDVISIHAPLNDDTQGLINAETLKFCKPTAYLINMGRGPIVDQDALADALKNGRIAGAALDVLKNEPMEPGNPLLEIQDSKKLIITPHIAWATVEARQRCVEAVFQNIKKFKES
ncbi:MAG: D-2-hydroxyacid dehydrogenase [Lachnospiraceae bacterium]|nr:D-2-hydroxyacid dehydrogenase [Lachnospiraceae bacterium]